MVRNQEIQKIFEVADDSLQSVLGFYFYIIALHVTAESNKIKIQLPTISGREAFPHTFDWIRYYTKEDLINDFQSPFLEHYQSQLSLIAITSVFNDALGNFVTKLKSKGHPPFLYGKKLGKNLKYWKLIEWAFHESQKCTIGSQKAITRLPNTFGIIDEARLLRNLIVHKHGIFDKTYEKHALNLKGLKKFTHPNYQKFKDTNNSIPVIINYEDIINFSRAHIEVLHILHNQIQKEYFGHPEAYSYERERKNIEWTRVLWGNTEKDDIKDYSRESYLKIKL